MKYKWTLAILGIIISGVLIFYGTIVFMFNNATGDFVEKVQSIAHDDKNDSFRMALDSTKSLIQVELDYPIVEKIIESKNK